MPDKPWVEGVVLLLLLPALALLPPARGVLMEVRRINGDGWAVGLLLPSENTLASPAERTLTSSHNPRLWSSDLGDVGPMGEVPTILLCGSLRMPAYPETLVLGEAGWLKKAG